MKKTIKTCCEHFSEMVNEGFVIREPKPVRHFARLLSRSIKGLRVSNRFYYCPFCGTKLDEGK